MGVYIFRPLNPIIECKATIIVKKNHKINFKSVIDKLSIVLEMEKCHSDKIIEKCSNLFKSKLRHLINEEVGKWSIQKNGSLFKKIILDLGEITFENFEQQFICRLERELKNKTHDFTKNIKQNIDNDLSASRKVKSMSKIPSISQYYFMTSKTLYSEQSVLENIDNYLKHGSWKSPDLRQQVKDVEFSYWLIEHVNHQPQKWLPMLAKHCLQPTGLSRLIQICPPDVLSMLCQLFTETTTSECVNSQTIINTKVTPEKLSLAAEYYLLHQMRYINATQQVKTALQDINNLTPVKSVTGNGNSPLTPDILETNILMGVAQSFSQHSMQTHHQINPVQLNYGLVKNSGEQKHPILQNEDQHKVALKSAPPEQVLPIQHGSDNTIHPQLSPSVLPISNAGCMILWPLLPTFFRSFDLLDQNRFTRLEAQREAVCLLDWLIWAEDEIPAWRLTLNKIICGLPINDNALWHTPEPEQQIAISQWLEKTIVQLPAWKKMGVNDVRYLFLQRSGELSELNGMTNIHIKPEVYDALISEWPWPINMASFSWLKQPITMTWL
ncbi:contractile injection system tape measure protein [Xenorhabdus sp. XENO-7]|uniref:Contractile injection system tape measure protein n=1 Tax=Xenorhabdus aichiensis TaxID=3025874 RepID=A0ABT5M0V8_9GAMM|nr:contractile injection system tape measure protein [Xenorhabdus aichiensis]MDC9621314.1 contractile injection system tape measure protein [Xenorhabdus aichiensis]